jgi:hypothetical protein
MKNNLIKLASFVLVAPFFLVGCEPDVVTYSGSDFVTLRDANFPNMNVTENAGTVSIPVEISSLQSTDVTVNYTLTSDDAVAGVNYNVLTPTIVIPAGQYSGTFQIEIIDDEDFNLNRTLKFELTGTSVASLGVGIADVGSYSKTITIVNNDYDCDTQFNYFLGNLNINTDGTATTSTGYGTAVCDILYIDGDLANYGNTKTYDIEFTADDSSGETGTVSVSTVIDPGYELSDGTIVDIVYVGEGIYDINSGQIVIDFAFDAYQGSTRLGTFTDSEGTTTITLAN